MPVLISNSITNASTGRLIQRVVLDEIGLQDDDWEVNIEEPMVDVWWFIRILGPKGFTWKRKFEGSEEQDANFVRNTVREAMVTYSRLS